MVEAVIMLGGLGLIVGAGLAVASKVFYVYVDPLIEAVDGELPGANCGGCGLPGCSANAEAIVNGQAEPNSCVAAGPETAEAIALLMGVSIEAREPDIARPGCTYGVQDAATTHLYDGISDCRAAALLAGGVKVCRIGCLGLGSCERACQFGAITMGSDGLPVVDEALCTGCGSCERVCPKHIINLSSVTRRILKEYTAEECTTPCQRACPAGINISEYIRQIALGDQHRAVQVIKERNPFPAVIGRICPRPCENECRRKLVDEPVAINFLKRYAADFEIESKRRVLPYKAPNTGRRVAVVGGGVQGLSTAFFAARLGHQPTVLEATDQAGGLLKTAIAAERLPQDVLNWDIEGIVEMGVEIKTRQQMGREVTLDGLLTEGFQAIFLALGGWDSRLTRATQAMSESPLAGLQLHIDFFKADDTHRQLIAQNRHVVVVAQGPSAVQVARMAQAAGADQVTVVARDRHALGSADRVALAEEIKSGGGKIRLLENTGVGRLMGAGNELTQIELIDLTTREVATEPADSLLLPAGRLPELVIAPLPKEPDPDASEEPSQEVPAQAANAWQAVEMYKHPDNIDQTGLLAQGDTLTDYSGAIKAIAAGRRGAATLHKVMYGIDLDLPRTVANQDAVVQDLDTIESGDVAECQRTLMPLASPVQINSGKELELGFDMQKAMAESQRCLQCGLICYADKGCQNP